MLYTADFETITDPEDCRIWAYGICEIGNTDNFIYGNNMDDFMKWCQSQESNTVYFHNLKFDGEFILYWLFRNGFSYVEDRRDLTSYTFTTLISDMGQFYSFEVCFFKKGKVSRTTKFLDSLKILNFSVSAIAKAFDLPISKLEIDYKLNREIGHTLTDVEIKYLKNDVEIVASALHILFEQGLNKMTQGSNALADYKKTVSTKNFKHWFPVPDYDADVRQSYKGGFTYCNPKYRGLDIGAGIVLDVNSLYPYVMHDKALPFGEGIYFKGRYEKDKFYNLYVQMFTCNFELKENHIPTIQLKNNLAFIPTEYLSSSDGEDITLCLTSVDLELFFDHYDVTNITWLSGWKFKSTTGLFSAYIDKWNEVKVRATIEGNTAMRTLAKLMLNALYGKFSLSPHVQSKYPVFTDGMVKYKLGEKEEREPIYIPVGTFITSWARNMTIRSAQKVYDRFIYADTDSLHLLGTEIPDYLEVDNTKLGAWKHESTFTRARFLRQKSYIEEIDGKLCITCAGMPTRCYEHVTWDNFREGASYDGKLTLKHVKGGIVLKDIKFSIKNH